MDTSDGICVELTGGFGNQLFGLAAGWARARELDCPLYLDASRYVRGDLRNFELDRLKLPGAVVVEAITQKSRRWSKARGGGVQRNLFRESGFGYDPRILETRPGAVLTGYFQSPKYFASVADDMEVLLRDAELSAEQTKTLSCIADDRRITMHMRRGDYLQSKVTAYHGVTSNRYFRDAYALLASMLHRELPIRVFSDSEVHVSEYSQWCSDVVVVTSDGLPDPLLNVLAMGSGSAMVMSNSSFSWWGAWLLSRSNAGAPIVAPRPWLAGGEAAGDLLLDDWLTLGI